MLDAYQDLIDELLGTPRAVREYLASEPTPDQLRLVAAMHERDAAVLERLQRMTREPFPHLAELPALADAVERAVLAGSAEDEIARFEATRGELVSLLMNLTLKDWERTATTEAGATITLADEVESHVEEDEAFRDRIGAHGG